MERCGLTRFCEFPGKRKMLFCFLFHHGNFKSVTLKFFFALKQVFSPIEVFAMDRFVSKRSSSSVDLDASSLDDVRAERAAIALSVGLSWPPDRYTKQTRGRPSRQLALGTSSTGPHPRAPRASTRCPLAAPVLVATRRSHRPAAHTRGARPHQDACRGTR